MTATPPSLVVLHRYRDPTGVSGEGDVAAGVVWPCGRLTVRWMCAQPPPGYDHPVHQVATYERVGDLEAVHGHGGATVVQPRDRVEGMTLFVAIPGDTAALPWIRGASWLWVVSWLGGPALAYRPSCPGPVPLAITHWPDGIEAARADLGLRLEAVHAD